MLRMGQQESRPGDPGITQVSLFISWNLGQGPRQVGQRGKTRLRLG